MTGAHGSEFSRIAALRSRFDTGPAAASAGVLLGIGDDAAVLAGGDTRALVWTIDAQIEGVHFRRDLASWHDVGWRAFMAAASDLAAMGAKPWCALSALMLPPSFDDNELDALVEGQRHAAEVVGAPIVGGNLARGDVVSITTTLLGRAVRPVARHGACAGDGLFIAGAVGLAAAGLRALERRVEDARIGLAVSAFRSPRARIDEGLAMASVAHAAIDVSDGLGQDIAHLAGASGLCAVIDEALLLAHTGDALAAAAETLGVRARDLALDGGEDYALVVASPVPIPGFTRIGELRQGSGVVLVTARGEEALAPQGYDHFGG